MKQLRFSSLSLLLVLCTHSSLAFAQVPEAPAPVDPARVAFQEGLQHLQEQRYAQALESFERSYQLRRVAAVALNLGIVLLELGRYVEANRRFQEFLEMATPAQHERFDRDVAGYLSDLRRRAGRIRITELTPESSLVLLDGRRASLDEHREILVDPGEHVLQVEADGFRSQRQVVRVAAASQESVRFSLQRDRPVETPPVPTTPPVTGRPWFWPVVLGGGALVLSAVGVGVWYVASEPAPLPAPNTGITVELLRFSPSQTGTPRPWIVLSGHF